MINFLGQEQIYQLREQVIIAESESGSVCQCMRLLYARMTSTKDTLTREEIVQLLKGMQADSLHQMNLVNDMLAHFADMV